MKNDITTSKPPIKKPIQQTNAINQAKRILRDLGWPTKKQECWKYTPCDTLQKRFQDATPAPKKKRENSTETMHVLSTQNHALCQRPRACQGIKLYTLDEAYRQIPEVMAQHFYTAINRQKHYFSHYGIAQIDFGFVIHVTENTTIKDIYSLRHHYTDKRLSHCYQLIVVEKNSQLKLLRSISAHGESISNLTTEIILKPNAHLSLYHIQNAGHKHIHINGNHILQHKQSELESFNLDLGGCISRTDIDIQLKEKGSSCKLLGLYQTQDGQYIDHHNEINHIAPQCDSSEHFRGILQGKSSATFNGKIRIGKGAQKTITKQLNKNILLSPQSEINSKPEFEIYANDVKANHGATVGQLDTEALHYLQCRGIPYEDAQGILIDAFSSTLFEEITDEALRKQIIAAKDKQ